MFGLFGAAGLRSRFEYSREGLWCVACGRLLGCLLFFFFQAEDGIRDDLVTGVQTCALPISNLKVSDAQLKRQQQLYGQHIITMDVLEGAQTQFASATALFTNKRANLDLAKQALIDARVTATVVGTILTKPVSIGQVIQAGGTSVSGGTVIATMEIGRAHV